MIDEELPKAVEFAGTKFEEFSAQEFEDRFDELFARVEEGETFIIRHLDGQKVYITPLNK